MATSFAGITTEAARKTAYAAAVAAAPSQATIDAAAQTNIQDHFCRALKSWAAQTGSDASEGNFKLRESLVDSAVLTTWTTELEAAGYVVTSADGFFTVSLSA